MGKQAKATQAKATTTPVQATTPAGAPQVNSWAQLAAPAAAALASNSAPATTAKVGPQYSVITLGPKAPKPRTSGQQGQASNTQLAWQTCANCIATNGGQATGAQLGAALVAVGLQYKTYVPYFATRCMWLAYGVQASAPQPAAPAATQAAA